MTRQFIASKTRPALAIAAILAAAGAAHAQCNPTFNTPPGITYPEGVNGNVLCSVLWDPDGAVGPKTECLIIGGTFDSANTGGYNNIAMFDGSGWKPLHIGVNGAVRALTVDTSSNTLIAGGDFSTAGIVSASKLARYSSSTGLWSAIGSGITSGGSVNALTYDSLRNVLYIGGSFSHAGGVNTGALARHNGSAYSAVGAFFSGTVNALFYYTGEDSVYVGGDFIDPTLGNAENILRYAVGPNSWSGLSGGLPGCCVNAIGIYSPDGLNQRIVAAGNFGTVNGRLLNSIATYEGSSGWFPLATGIAGTVRGITTRDFGRDLYVVGSFTLTGAGSLVNNVARYNGTFWSAAGTGLDATAFTAATYKDAVYVGGSFTLAGNVDGNTTATRIAMHDGSRWSPLRAAPSGPVRCMLSFGTSLLIGGNFDMHVGNNVFAHNLVSFNGTEFSAGVGIQGFNGTNGPINAIMYKSNGVQIGSTTVAGKFTQAGAINASNIASYQFAGEFSQVGSGVNGEVYGLAAFGTTGGPFATPGTVATGNFTAAGATPVGFIARWGPGTASTNLGTGLNAPGRCLMNFQGKLLVGGYFTTAGGVLTGHLAQWDGTTWSTFNGTIVNDHVQAMTVFNGKLVIGGDFTLINGQQIRKVAMYDGSQWVDMSAGMDTSVGSVTALAVHNGELYAGGYFATTGAQPRAIAKWNGFSWVDLGTGENPSSVNVIGSMGGDLYIGGDFLRAGSAYTPYLSKHACACYVNCDNSTGSPVLTANDFTCFLNNYVLGTSYANCDGSTGNPALTANDFSCFVTRYASGCN
jgi:trimeric autotransporter adhesin